MGEEASARAGDFRQPLRVLFVSHSFSPPGRPEENVGGMQRVAEGLADALAALDSVQLESEVLRASARLSSVRTAIFLARLLRAIPQRVKRGDVDVIVFSSMVTASLSVLLKPALRRAGVRTVAIAHGRDVTLRRFGYQRLVRLVLASLAAVFPVSRAVARECHRRGTPPDRVFVVPNGIRIPSDFDESWESSRGPTPSGARAAPNAARSLRLLSVGRQVKRKGFEWFVRRVFPLLPPEVEYWVVGDGPGLRALQTAVVDVGAGDRIRLLGRVSEAELDAVYRAAHLLIMPNIHVEGDLEGFGVVALEAGLRGVPVIASDCEGMRDVVVEGVNGYRVAPGDAQRFADVIGGYTTDAREREELGCTARKLVRETYAWPAVAREFVSALHEAMQIA